MPPMNSTVISVIFCVGVFLGISFYSHFANLALGWWYRARDLLAVSVGVWLGDPKIIPQLIDSAPYPTTSPSGLGARLGLLTFAGPIAVRRLHMRK